MQKNRQSKIKAFTLAEVLITLGIIGVVAEMTIPDLVQQTQDNVYKTAYKKAYSTLSQALEMANLNGEIQEVTVWGSGTTRVNNFNALKKYFKVVTNCPDNGNNSNCWASGEVFYGWVPSAAAPAFIDSSGMSWAVDDKSSQDGPGQDIAVDTNGPKGPNKCGVDRFMLFPNTADGSGIGLPLKFTTYNDCLSTTNCPGSGYTNTCPSVAKHPCYYQSWLLGGG